jgi:hypothetical protein
MASYRPLDSQLRSAAHCSAVGPPFGTGVTVVVGELIVVVGGALVVVDGGELVVVA